MIENIPDWIYQTALSLIVSGLVFVSGLWATQGRMIEKIESLQTTVQTLDARQREAITQLRNDIHEMRRDLYVPRKGDE